MGLLALATRIADRNPALGRHLKAWFVGHAVPANRSLGIRVVRVAEDGSEVVLRLLDRRRNRNVGGTVHGGVQLALAETVHGVAVMWRFPPPDHAMVSARSEIEFQAPARGALTAHGGVDAAARAAIEEGLAARGRAEVTLESEVRDASGRPVARLRARYVVRRRGALAATPPRQA